MVLHLHYTFRYVPYNTQKSSKTSSFVLFGFVKKITHDKWIYFMDHFYTFLIIFLIHFLLTCLVC